MKRAWWKEVVMYQIYPRSFQDSNGDGIGDLRGIINRLDYLADLGIDLIWLGPVYDSPNDDNGYDISNYYWIHPEFGTMDDFDELLNGLHQRNIKLIMDLVVNHSSDEHEWFKESKKSRDNPFRDFYYWRKGKNGNPPNNWKAFFGGSAWQYDDTTGEYYLHLFTAKQPDLNWENPALRKEIYKMMRFWLDKGVDGFRMDVISLISKRLEFEDSPEDNLMYMVNNYYANGPRIHEFLQEMHKEVLSEYDIMTVGEGPGISKEVVNEYIGEDRNELNMVFQLDLMFRDNGPGGKFDYQAISLLDFKKLFREWDKAVANRGWNNIFLDNHDFPRMVSRFGNDSHYREESAKLLLCFLLTMRGTPCIYMGSEIGMTNVAFENPDDYRDIETINYFNKVRDQGKDMAEALKRVHVQGRDNVRTPLQWSDEKHAGFTSGKPWIKVNPNYKEINVRKDKQNHNSIIQFLKKLIHFRKEHDELVYGDLNELLKEHPHIYAYSRNVDKSTVYIVLNFSDLQQSIANIVDLSNMKIAICNYFEEGEQEKLRPWEARIYTQ